MIKLESDRLFYEYLEEKHFTVFCEQEMDPVVMQYIRKASSTLEEARIKFNDYFIYMNKCPGLGVFAVFEKSSQRQVGLAVILHIEANPEIDKYEVGYRLEQASWGKGYATEITHTFLKYGFETLKLSAIHGTTHPDNLVSQKVLMKAGMKDLGTTTYRNGSRFFGITRDEYHHVGDCK